MVNGGLPVETIELEKARSVRRPKGHIFFTGMWGELLTGDTLQCCHCGTHWVVMAGSGIKRGFCMKCNQYHCGAAACEACVPYEQRLENIEAGRPELTPKPETVAVPDSPALIVPPG